MRGIGIVRMDLGAQDRTKALLFVGNAAFESSTHTILAGVFVPRSSREHTRPTPALATRSTPHGRSLEVVRAGRHCAASAAYLHPLADAHQVKHILGAAAHAARATDLIAGDDQDAGPEHIEHARRRATPAVVEVLKRYPAAPPSGGRVGELLRDLDEALRGRF